MTQVLHILTTLSLCALLTGGIGQVWGEAGHPVVIDLDAEGPHPQQLAVVAGTAVIWVSHLAHTRQVVVPVTFTEGLRVAQATRAVQGYNGFILERHDFIGRMQGDGGKVALRFVTPGTYTYTLDHDYRSGTIVVR